MIKYDGDRNKNAMVELLGNKIDVEPSRKETISAVVRATVGDSKLDGIYRLTCTVVYSRSLSLEYLEIRGQIPLWASEDYYNVYKILNDVCITGFMLWKEYMPYVFSHFRDNWLIRMPRFRTVNGSLSIGVMDYFSKLIVADSVLKCL